MARRYAARTDKNQSTIVNGLRRAFGPDCVFDLSAVGDGMTDIIVGVRSVNILLEIKTDDGELTEAQEVFHATWRGQLAVVRSLDEALQVIEQETT